MNKTRLAVILVILIILIGGALALTRKPTTNKTGTLPASTTVDTQATNDQATPGGNITMKNMMFTPSQITIKKGASVTWTNNDTVTHTVVIDQGEGPISGDIAPGATYSYTYTKAGSYQYHCGIHSSMRGTIVVQ